MNNNLNEIGHLVINIGFFQKKTPNLGVSNYLLALKMLNSNIHFFQLAFWQ